MAHALIKRAHRRLWWGGALTSLWSPLTILVVALLPYLLVVEMSENAVSWAQPLMKGFALCMVVYYFALLAARLALPRFRELRRVRHEASEVLGEVEAALARAPKLEETTRNKVMAQAAVVDAQRLEGNQQALAQETKKLIELAERNLTSFRQSPTLDLVMGLLKALAIALVIRTVLIEPYRIPSGSMIPTLEVGNQIFVNKFIYGVRAPLLNWVPFKIVRAPLRGDVIVFENPVQMDRFPLFRDDYIKRVAGVPGDRIELKNDVVYVNGVEQPRTLVSPDYNYWDITREGEWFPANGRLYQEVLSGHPHSTLQSNGGPGRAEEGPFVVPPGHVFVMGDNRDNSLDSRYGLGALDRRPVYVPYGNIKGKAMIIWLSLAHGGFLSPLTGHAGLRTDRLFQRVQ